MILLQLHFMHTCVPMGPKNRTHSLPDFRWCEHLLQPLHYKSKFVYFLFGSCIVLILSYRGTSIQLENLYHFLNFCSFPGGSFFPIVALSTVISLQIIGSFGSILKLFIHYASFYQLPSGFLLIQCFHHFLTHPLHRVKFVPIPVDPDIWVISNPNYTPSFSP